MSRRILGLTVITAAWCAAATAQEPEAESGGLQEIIVSAQRREENLQRAAVPVSAVSGESLVSAGITETVSLSKLVPSLVIQPAGGTTMNFYLRGVGTLQGNSFGENPVAFNFDGVYVARPTSPVGTFFDLERIEVVKGPQGTLYGRNATGGAINVLPKRPVLDEFGGDLMVELGDFESRKGSATFNIPLGATTALRIAAQAVDREGYMSDGYSDEVGQAARASFLIEPSERFSAVLVADYFHQDGNGVGSVLMPGAAFPDFFPGYAAPDPDDRIGGSDPRSLAALQAFAATQFAPPFCGGPGGFITSGCVAPPRDDGFIDSDFYGVTATIEADLGFATLTALPAYRRSEGSFDGFLPGFLTRMQEENEQNSIEVRLASNAQGRTSYVVGAYYFTEDQDATNYFEQGAISTTFFTPDIETTSKAIFGQLTFSLTDTFRLVGGARYTDESREQLTSLAAGGRPGPVNPPPGPPFPGALDFSKTTWKAGIEWDVAEQSLLYANVATGFKAGGFFVASPPNNTFLPEELAAYTIGAKNRFLDNRLQLNLEAFYWDYEDQQITFVGGISSPAGITPGALTINAGQAEMKGLELEMQAAAGNAGLFTANLQYLDGEYESLVFTALSASGAPIRTGCLVSGSRQANPGTPNPSRLFDLDCSGKPAINSPEWSANLGYEHRFQIGGDKGLVLGARTRLESSRYLNIDYLPEQHQDSYKLSDLYLTLFGPDDRWSFTAFVNNIEDETVLSGAFTRPVLQTVYGSLHPPRTYGGRFTYRF
jgi:iron complex outermembrane recepter protein